MCVCVYVYTHTHTHTHIYIYINLRNTFKSNYDKGTLIQQILEINNLHTEQ